MTDVQAEAGPSSSSAPKPSTIPIRLTSRSERYAIPESKYMVPSDWRRFQLSELINKVLETTQAVPFDFIIDDQLLRTSLAAYTESKGLTEETVLEIEFVESILPPKYLSSFEHEDWISDISLGEKGSFLTSAYDGNVRIFSSSGIGLQHTLSGHKLAVLSTCWLPSASTTSSSSSSSSTRYVASGSMDRSIRVFQVPDNAAAGESATATATPTTSHILNLHTAPVSSVRSWASPEPDRRQLISAGWDGLVGFWDFSLAGSEGDAEPSPSVVNGGEEEDGPKSKKRRKGVNGGVAAASSSSGKTFQVAPTITLHAHAGTVSRAVFDASSDGNKAFSFGQDDHSVRHWDLQAGGEQIAIKQSDKAIMDGEQMASPNLLVTGNADRTVCLWDMRESNTIISLTLTGHTSSVSSVAAHPTSPLLLCSASYDSTVRIWDARSPKQALFSIPRQKKKNDNGATEKIVSVAWDGQLVASGGEDGRLELFQSKGAAL